MKPSRRGEAEPFPPGTEFTIKKTGKKAQILKECPCTDSYLHYLAVWEEDKREFSILHSDVVDDAEISCHIEFN